MNVKRYSTPMISTYVNDGYKFFRILRQWVTWPHSVSPFAMCHIIRASDLSFGVNVEILVQNDQTIKKEIVAQLNKIYEGIYECGKKIFSATKFIDFFVFFK